MHPTPLQLYSLLSFGKPTIVGLWFGISLFSDSPLSSTPIGCRPLTPLCVVKTCESHHSPKSKSVPPYSCGSLIMISAIKAFCRTLLLLVLLTICLGPCTHMYVGRKEGRWVIVVCTRRLECPGVVIERNGGRASVRTTHTRMHMRTQTRTDTHTHTDAHTRTHLHTTHNVNLTITQE